jgi:hypothetical protein
VLYLSDTVHSLRRAKRSTPELGRQRLAGCDDSGSLKQQPIERVVKVKLLELCNNRKPPSVDQSGRLQCGNASANSRGLISVKTVVTRQTLFQDALKRKYEPLSNQHGQGVVLLQFSCLGDQTRQDVGLA